MPPGKLLPKLIRRAFEGVLLPLVLLFVPAGTLKFWQGWALMAASLIFPGLLVLCFYKRDPQLIERRLLTREKITEHKRLSKIGGAVFVLSFMLSGFDYRFGWSRRLLTPVPLWLTLLALALTLACELWILRVVSVNRFAARIVQVEAGQTVADRGPYRIVRHPMYSATIVMWLAAPLALGSFIAWPAFALMVPLIIVRLLKEEAMLRRELPGYFEYCRRTRYRLVSGVW